MAFLQRGAMSEDRSTTSTTTAPTESSSAFFSARSARQFGIFLGGAAFVGLSSLITRRALVSRYRLTKPKFFQPSNQAGAEVSGATDALDALSLATVNVTSVALMLSGGALWAFDISTLEELRQTLRSQLHLEPGEGGNSEVDREAEEWLASVLARTDDKENAERPEQKGFEGVLTTIMARKVQEQKTKSGSSSESGKDQ